jgi:hypothetical protein
MVVVLARQRPSLLENAAIGYANDVEHVIKNRTESSFVPMERTCFGLSFTVFRQHGEGSRLSTAQLRDIVGLWMPDRSTQFS